MGNKALAKELDILKALYAHLEDGKLAKSFETEDEGRACFHQFPESAHMETSNLLPPMYAKRISPMTAQVMNMLPGYVTLHLRQAAKYLLSAHRLSRKLPNSMKKRKRCFRGSGLTESGLEN